MATFKGTNRFKLIRKLGAGGMGIVYEAEDQQRQARVALKTLNQTDADLLYRLKREFRSLRDVVHRNLVSLDELFEEDGHWFFTMELVDGVSLSAHLRGTTGAANSLATEVASMPQLPRFADRRLTETLPMALPVGSSPSLQPPAFDASHLVPLDFGRVRSAFGQITEGLLAIHDAGKNHRDIKPSNIMVTRDGR